MNKRKFKILFKIIFIVCFSIIILVNYKHSNTYINKESKHINSVEENETFIKESEEHIGIPNEDTNEDFNDKKDDLEYDIIELKKY